MGRTDPRLPRISSARFDELWPQNPKHGFLKEPYRVADSKGTKEKQDKEPITVLVEPRPKKETDEQNILNTQATNSYLPPPLARNSLPKPDLRTRRWGQIPRKHPEGWKPPERPPSVKFELDHERAVDMIILGMLSTEGGSAEEWEDMAERISEHFRWSMTREYRAMTPGDIERFYAILKERRSDTYCKWEKVAKAAESFGGLTEALRMLNKAEEILTEIE